LPTTQNGTMQVATQVDMSTANHKTDC